MNIDASPITLAIIGLVCAAIGYWLVSRIIDFFTTGSSWEDEWRNRDKK